MLTLAIIVAGFVPVMADAPFEGFTYNFWGDYVPTPAAYVPVLSVGGRDFGIGDFTTPQDISSDLYGNIYVADTGNNRIVKFDRNIELVWVIDSFLRDGQPDSFNSPNGIFVSEDMLIHIADTESRRIITLDQEGNFVREIGPPEFGDLDEAVDFRPLKVLVDRGGRVFVSALHVVEGMMTFNSDGDFMGYYGTIRVFFNPIDMLWRFLSTQEQRARQAMFIPTEFAGMDIDPYGFIFATNRAPWGDNMVQRLNPRGENVLLNLNTNVQVTGSQRYRITGPLSGRSMFVDVAARSHGMFSVLDSIRGRVYTYDSEGNLLYAFAGIGNILGMSRNPVAIEAVGDSLLILDDRRGHIIYFEPTEYGNLINSAIALAYDGDGAGAVEKWTRLLEIDEHFTLAHVGIGRAHLAAGENRLAMEYLQRGMDVRYYSVALRRFRTEILSEVLPYVLTVGLAGAVAIVGFRIFKRFKKGGAVS